MTWERRVRDKTVTAITPLTEEETKWSLRAKIRPYQGHHSGRDTECLGVKW